MSLVVVIPLQDALPSTGLDPSWKLALAEIDARGLDSGSDVVFTTGPLGTYYAATRVPGGPPTAVLVGIILGLVLALLVWNLTAALDTRLRGVALAGAVFALSAGVVNADALLLSLPLLLVVLVARTGHDASRADLGVVLLGSASLGLLPLIKLSPAPLVVASLVLCFAMLAARGRPGAGLLAIGACAAAAALAWVVTGQPLTATVSYVRMGAEVVAGYPNSMMSGGSGAKPLAVVTGGCSVLLLVATVMLRSRVTTTRLDNPAVVLMAALSVFVSVRAGFVRPDPAHVPIVAGVLLVVAGVVITSHQHIRWWQGLVVLVIGGLLWCAALTQPGYPGVPVAALHRSWVDNPSALARAVGVGDTYAEQYSSAESKIRRSPEAPSVPALGTVDLYPSELSYLFASDARWSPRPAFQSYVAYTPELAETNRQHLVGSGRPDHLLVKVDPIDGRWAPDEDGASWLEMASRYDLGPRDASAYLRLDVREDPRRVEYGEPVSTRVDLAGTDVPVTIPDGWDGVTVSVDLRPTLLGRARSALWRASESRIVLTTADGTQVERRWLTGLAPTDLVLSPRVDDTEDLAALLAPAGPVTPDRQVTAVRFNLGGGARYWQSSAVVTMRPYRVAR